MTSPSDRRDANEVLIATVIAGVVGYFALVVLEAASMYEPIIAKPPRTDIELMPDRKHCSGLDGEEWINCMVPK